MPFGNLATAAGKLAAYLEGESGSRLTLTPTDGAAAIALGAQPYVLQRLEKGVQDEDGGGIAWDFVEVTTRVELPIGTTWTDGDSVAWTVRNSSRSASSASAMPWHTVLVSRAR